MFSRGTNVLSKNELSINLWSLFAMSVTVTWRMKSVPRMLYSRDYYLLLYLHCTDDLCVLQIYRLHSFGEAPIDTVEPFLSAHLNKQCYGLRSNSIECLMFYVECIENTSIRRRVEINVATMRILPYKKVDKSYIYVASLPIQQLMLHLCKSTFFAPTRFICSLCEVNVWSFKTVAAMMPEYVVSNANIFF